MATSLALLGPQQARKILDRLKPDQIEALRYDWKFWARPNQLPPSGDWNIWLLLAGRGFGKTRTGAEYVRVLKNTCDRIALVAPTSADVRDVIVEGESGILRISPPHDRPVYEPSKRRLTWQNGAIATCYSADEPDRLRGPQHSACWGDELAAWRYPEAYDMLMFGLRLGKSPKAVFTTTPKPVKIVRELLKDPRVAVTRGSTYDNAANLAGSFLTQIVNKYEGTRLGRQELNAEMLEDTPGALWNRDLIDSLRVAAAPPLRRIVVAIDPAVTSGEQADETGIIVIGFGKTEGVEHGYVLEDLSGRYQPEEWARKAVDAYRRWKADRIIAEVNNGGDMVESTIRVVDRSVAFKQVRATRGKVVRAEPVSALYEKRRVHHVGFFHQLEDQMCCFTTDFDKAVMGFSPDRLDALVWGATEMLQEGHATVQPLRL